METVKGYVEHIVFRNEDNGYTVFNLNNDDGDLTCVGNFNYLSEGELVEVNGEYVVHSIYGTQLRVLNYEIKAPEDLLSIERYLGSGAIKGVGASLAGRIVKKFREDTFRIIEEEPERLAEVRGISERMAREIAVQVEEKKDMRKAMIFRNLGFRRHLQQRFISFTVRRPIRYWKEIHTSLQIRFRESDLRSLMKSQRRSASIQTRISVSGVVFFIPYSRVLPKGMSI